MQSQIGDVTWGFIIIALILIGFIYSPAMRSIEKFQQPNQFGQPVQINPVGQPNQFGQFGQPNQLGQLGARLFQPNQLGQLGARLFQPNQLGQLDQPAQQSLYQSLYQQSNQPSQFRGSLSQPFNRQLGQPFNQPFNQPLQQPYPSLQLQSQPAVNIKVNWIATPYGNGRYGNYAPALELPRLVQELGLPDVIDVNQDGVAIWKEDTLKSRGFCWQRVEIHDEQIPTNNLFPYVAYINVWKSMPIAPYISQEESLRIIDNIRSLSNVIEYDTLTQSARVLVPTMGIAKAILVLVKRMSTKQITLQQAQNLYAQTIASTIPSSPNYDSTAEKKYEIEICSNQNLNQIQTR